MNNTVTTAASAKGNPIKVIGKISAILTNSWLLFPAFFFYIQVSKNLTNIPTMDDFNMPLEYVMNFTKAGFQGKSGMIFAQYAEHRLVPSKLIYISYYYITGGLNFRILGILGDLQLLVVAFVGIHFIKKYLPESWRLLAFIWALVVFDLNTYENACMTMNAMGNYGVICYFFAALYFYDKEDRWIPIAVLFQFFCIFSNANGLAAGVFIALFNIAKSPRKRTISLIASCIFIGLYFINFHTVTLPNKLPFDLNLPVIFFIRQSGAHFSFNNSLLIGLLVLALLAVLFPWRQLFQPRFTPILCIFLFPLCTMFLAAAFRSCYSDAQFQTSRYLMYPQMMIGCLCLFAWMKLKSVLQKRVGGSVIVGIMLFAYAGNYKFGKLGFERTNYHATTVKFWHPHPAECEKICKEACERDIYCIEDNK